MQFTFSIVTRLRHQQGKGRALSQTQRQEKSVDRVFFFQFYFAAISHPANRSKVQTNFPLSFAHYSFSATLSTGIYFVFKWKIWSIFYPVCLFFSSNPLLPRSRWKKVEEMATLRAVKGLKKSYDLWPDLTPIPMEKTNENRKKKQTTLSPKTMSSIYGLASMKKHTPPHPFVSLKKKGKAISMLSIYNFFPVRLAQKTNIRLKLYTRKKH
jgi:hypothetical protein